MRRWSLRRRREVTMSRKEPIRLVDALREVPGKWVAVRDRRVVDVAETPDRLHHDPKDRGIRGATIMGSPGDHEPLQVGLG
jgi:hypothetical protein